MAALKFFSLTEGVILTIDQEDPIHVDGYTINVVPAYEFDFIEQSDEIPIPTCRDQPNLPVGGWVFHSTVKKLNIIVMKSRISQAKGVSDGLNYYKQW